MIKYINNEGEVVKTFHNHNFIPPVGCNVVMNQYHDKKIYCYVMSVLVSLSDYGDIEDIEVVVDVNDEY